MTHESLYLSEQLSLGNDDPVPSYPRYDSIEDLVLRIAVLVRRPDGVRPVVLREHVVHFAGLLGYPGLQSADVELIVFGLLERGCLQAVDERIQIPAEVEFAARQRMREQVSAQRTSRRFDPGATARAHVELVRLYRERIRPNAA